MSNKTLAAAGARSPKAGAARRPTVFIDGEAGTTGLEIRRRLADVAGVEVKSIAAERRKDEGARLAIMREADLIVLCLPDQAAVEAVAFLASLGDEAPRVVDASTAHRVAEGWVYGFPELAAGQADVIRRARRVANPGCYPTGAIALLRPLVDTGLLPADYPVTVNAVSGYSGGGRSMIEAYEAGTAPPFELYGLGLEHKHVPELQRYAGLARRPIFVPSVGNFRQGMLVSVPLHLDTLPGRPTLRDLEAALAARYAEADLIEVVPAGKIAKGGRLDALALNGTDRLELTVLGNEALGQAVLVARLDNLGKGASGAAVQNIRLMLGVAD
jgi:N-acetyl-gamma-glutamyl-phosphate reductase